MPIVPTAPQGSPNKQVFEVQVPSATILQSQTATAIVVPNTGYVTAVKHVGLAGITGADNPSSRKFTVVDPTTRVVADGIVTVLGTSAFKGQWSATPGYAVGDVVVYNNQQFVCIATATTEVPTDTTKFQAVDSFGLSYLTSRTAGFTLDDVDKTVTGTGYTSARIVGVVNSRTAIISSPNSAVRNALSVTIGASRTLATLSLVSGVNVVANVQKAYTLDLVDTKVYKGDVIQVLSAADGGTGLADTGGATVVIEVTSFNEGT